MTGLSRQTINVIMRQLEEKGLIKVRHRLIEIRDSQRLTQYCLENTDRISEML